MEIENEISEVEKLLKIEQKEQKRTASGIRGRATRLGKVGIMRTAYDFLSNKEKKQYKKAGEVNKYFMYQNKIYEFDEFKALPTNQQREALQYWRENFGQKAIKEKWGKDGKPMGDGTLYNYINKLNLPKAEGNRSGKTMAVKPIKIEDYPYLQNLMKYKDIKKLDKEKRTEILNDYVTKFSNGELILGMEFSSQSTYFSYLKSHDVSTSSKPNPDGLVISKIFAKEKRQYNRKPKEEISTEENKAAELKLFDVQTIINSVLEQLKPKEEPKSDGFSFSFNGVYDNSVIVNRLTNIAGLLDSENKKFKISLIVEEIEEKMEVEGI